MKLIKYLFLALAVMLMSMASASYVAPGAPTALTPGSGQVITDYTPTLTWSASAPATGTTITGFQLQTSLASDFSYTTTSYNRPVSLNFTIPNANILDPGRSYYWHVRAKNNLGEWSIWSNTARFRTAIQRPIALNPLDGDTSATNPNLLDLRPTFQWTSFTGAQSFTLQVSKECDFTSMTINVEVANTAHSYTPGVDLPADTHFCWRVRANNSTYGPSGWTAIQSFLTANPPTVPVLIDPVDKTLTNDNSPRFDWSDSITASTTSFDHYEIEIANKSSFSNYTYHRLVSIVPSKYDVPDEYNPPADLLPGARTYYWRVRSFNTEGERSVWSVVRTLLITVDRPKNLTIIPNPPTDPRPLFDWSNVYRAERYHIVISTPGVELPIIDVYTVTSQYLPTTDLPAGVNIYWKVYALDINGPYDTSLDSDTQTFLSANAPSTPFLISPASNAILTDTTPGFRWSGSTFPAGTTFDHYQIKIAENASLTISVISRNRTVTAYTLPVTLSLSHGKTYYWSVRTCNTAGQCSSWADVRSFKIPPFKIP